MYNNHRPDTYPYWTDTKNYDFDDMAAVYGSYQQPYYAGIPVYNSYFYGQYANQNTNYFDAMESGSEYVFSGLPSQHDSIQLKDYGPEPFVVNIEEATTKNNTFRTALWTGTHLQLTLMSIKVGEEIGLETHPNLDQFIRIEEGRGLVKMGDRKDNLNFQREVGADFAFIIPAGKWHNLINTGNRPIKLYSIYAPPQHPRGTVHLTKADSDRAESHSNH